ncbi:MAG: ATP-binding cassette domain-containing protein [Candidatus Tectomicrobia bacterium]|nr:ATP-binding cassette domain-containing protein [Candidatus Tectomicrobia bacterium]
MIEVKNLSKRFGNIEAVSKVSFEVQSGEVLGFLGPNGAGKTTTMRILTCFLPATEGSATVAGYDVFSEPLEVRRRIGYLPEGVPLYSELRVSEYLNFVAEVKGVPRRQRQGSVAKVLEECGLAHMTQRTVGKLSKGYRQRVGIAQALVNDPEVLILDEPTIGLDPQQIVEIRELIKNMAGRRTVILSSHILPEVNQICQRVTIINRGKIVAVDTPENLHARLQKGRALYLQVDGPLPQVQQALRGVPGVLDVAPQEMPRGDGAQPTVHAFQVTSSREVDVRRELARTVHDRQWGLLEMRPLSMSLEEIFIQLVTEEQGVA